MATKGSDKFPKGGLGVGDVTKADLNKVSSDLTEMLEDLETEVTELKAKESDVTESELKSAIDDVKATIKTAEDAIAELKAKAPDVTKADLTQVSNDLTEMISDLEAEVTELKAKEPDVTEAELKSAVDDAKTMVKAVEDAVAELKAKAPDVTKALFDQTVENLETSIAALPTSAQLDAVKTDVAAVQDKLADLDTNKADKTAVEAANKAIKDVDTALKALAALPPDVSQQELDAAIADYTKKLKAADDAIAAANQSILSITPVGAGKTLDLNSIKATGSGFWNGAALSGAPLNGGSGGSGRWSYTGDSTTGDMEITVWTAPTLRQIEGGWVRSRVAGTWGEWTVAPKASDFQVTKGATDAITGESWAIAVGHVVTLSYVDVSLSIKLKPHNTTWNKVTQYVAPGFTVPNKPASGAAIVELKFNSGKGGWEAVTTVDPLDTRMVAVETKAAANETAIAGVDTRLKALEGTNYNLENYALDSGKLYTVVEALGLNSLVHLRSDGKAELASDKDINKPADGIVLGTVAANGTTKIYGTGARVSDLGQAGSLTGARFFLGTGGAISTSATGTGRLVQEVAVYNGSTYLMDFRDRGYFVA